MSHSFLAITIPLILILILSLHLSSYHSINFAIENYQDSGQDSGVFASPPIRSIPPDLYPTTGPVDMLNLKKFLIQDGYRFQNSLFAPVPINSDLGLAESDRYPNSYRQRTGVFQERMFVEKTPQTQPDLPIHENFAAGGTASPGTIIQMNSRGGPDHYLMSTTGDPRSDRQQESPFAMLARPQVEAEINYQNQLFSWGDIIHRFYNPSHHRYSPGIVI